jgi:hypothetical protein
MRKEISTQGKPSVTPEGMSEAIGTMEKPKTRDIKKESRPDTPGKSQVDRMAYKQCVEQQKRSGSSNPWAVCNAQFGIGKSETMPDTGMSYRGLQKKEERKIHTTHSSAKHAAAAQKEHMKPTHPQIKAAKPRKVAAEAPVYKTELEPGMSWNKLRKMQTEEPLLKKPKV